MAHNLPVLPQEMFEVEMTRLENNLVSISSCLISFNKTKLSFPACNLLEMLIDFFLFIHRDLKYKTACDYHAYTNNNRIKIRFNVPVYCYSAGFMLSQLVYLGFIT